MTYEYGEKVEGWLAGEDQRSVYHIWVNKKNHFLHGMVCRNAKDMCTVNETVFPNILIN